MSFDGQPCAISASIGIALSGQRPDVDMTKLVDDADIALYAAKKAGRGCFRFFDRRRDPEMDDQAPARGRREEDRRDGDRRGDAPFDEELRPANDRRRPTDQARGS